MPEGAGVHNGLAVNSLVLNRTEPNAAPRQHGFTGSTMYESPTQSRRRNKRPPPPRRDIVTHPDTDSAAGCQSEHIPRFPPSSLLIRPHNMLESTSERTRQKTASLAANSRCAKFRQS